MPPKAKITREMIVDAAFRVARENGAENINARTVSTKLGCSTQPVMYHFRTIEDMKREAYRKADAYHGEYLMRFYSEEPMLDIGMNYIRFAATEKNLFRFLFQSDGFSGKNMTDLINDDALLPILDVLGESEGVNREKAKEIFMTLFLYVHGYASLLANNAMIYEEESAAAELKKAYAGAIYGAKSEETQ